MQVSSDLKSTPCSTYNSDFVIQWKFADGEYFTYLYYDVAQEKQLHFPTEELAKTVFVEPSI